MSTIILKICGDCKVEKPISEFYKKKVGKFGVGHKCKMCDDARKKKWNSENRERRREQSNQWARDNPEKIKASAKKWRENHREEKKTYDDEWRKNNPDKARSTRRKASRQYRSKGQGRLAMAMSSAVNSALKGSKKGRKTFELVGYSLAKLKRHLEKKFLPGMTWDNYGEWHVDHKVPKSVFNYTSPDHIDFKRCWALSNLQPLWAKDNLIKSNKFEGDFQPSLPIAANDNSPARLTG